MRVGLLGEGFVNWGGGIDFLRMVVSSLHCSGEPVELHVLVPSKGPKVTALRAVRYVYRGARAIAGYSGANDRPDSRHLADLAGDAEQSVAVHEIDIGLAAIASTARKLSIDVLVPVIKPLPSDFQVPWVGYICDFQHRHFPHLFSSAERERRDRLFKTMLARARAVIVNARAVAHDISQFHPEAQARVFTLPFSAAPQASWLIPREFSASRYGIDRPYFIICNQFWKHKDHATAFSAFAQFAAANADVDLVCTGSTGDYRDPGHMLTLTSALARDGISDRVHILGMVPKDDQIALLKGAIALIQPTLFEGGPGGFAVYDAVSVGQRCLVSDIAVNRELEEKGIEFFPAGDASALAGRMAATVRQPWSVGRGQNQLGEIGRARRAACGVRILEAVGHAQVRP